MTTIVVFKPDTAVAPAAPAEYVPLPDEPDVWLKDEDVRAGLAGLLHTEVGHSGRCYGVRAVYAALAAVPLAALGAVAHAAGRHVKHGGLTEVLTRWYAIEPHIAVLTLAGLLALCVSVAIGSHAWWHRAEAPFAGNVVLHDSVVEAVDVLAAGRRSSGGQP